MEQHKDSTKEIYSLLTLSRKEIYIYIITIYESSAGELFWKELVVKGFSLVH